MSKNTDDTGMIEALLQRLNEFRLPRLLELQDRVNSGETLTEYDLSFLENVLEEVHSIEGLIKRHPEVQPLAAKAIALYHDIVAKGLENESKTSGR
jgi:hypothetical protein